MGRQDDSLGQGATHACESGKSGLSMKGFTSLALVLAVCAALLSGCAATPASGPSEAGGGPVASQGTSSPMLENCAIARDADYGNICLDVTIERFNSLGFAYGDSVDVAFSNGYELKGIPYYNGYYARVGELLLVGYPGYSHIEVVLNYGDSLWEAAGLSENDTATVRLAEAGAYRTIQESLNISYSDDRSDYASDEQFGNFRPLEGGSLQDGVAYRSASPIANMQGRAPYVERLMEGVGIAYDLDLSDDADDVARFVQESQGQGVDLSYFKGLESAGAVGKLGLNVSYQSAAFAQKLSSGLIDMSQHEGPYLIHCIEGKDRTGFVCALLEALCGASYEEIVADYMITYENYYGITKESAPDSYNAIAGLNIDGMLAFLAGVDDSTADLRTLSYEEPARNYLKAASMSDEQINALAARLTQ